MGLFWRQGWKDLVVRWDLHGFGFDDDDTDYTVMSRLSSKCASLSFLRCMAIEMVSFDTYVAVQDEFH